MGEEIQTIIVLLFLVDDIIIADCDIVVLNEIRKCLRNKLKMKGMGRLT